MNPEGNCVCGNTMFVDPNNPFSPGDMVDCRFPVECGSLQRLQSGDYSCVGDVYSTSPLMNIVYGRDGQIATADYTCTGGYGGGYYDPPPSSSPMVAGVSTGTCHATHGECGTAVGTCDTGTLLNPPVHTSMQDASGHSEMLWTCWGTGGDVSDNCYAPQACPNGQTAMGYDANGYIVCQ